jgi:hypothetical protein
MFRRLQEIYETEQTVSGTGAFNLVIPNQEPDRTYYVYITRILLGSAGLNITITNPQGQLIDKFVERYWGDNVFTVDKHYVNEIVVVSKADASGNLTIASVQFSERTDSASISPKSFFIAIWGEIREGHKDVIATQVP